MTDVQDVLNLTERQFTVLRGVAHRKTIKKIASELGLSPSTVNEHLSAAKRRAGAGSTDELVAMYFENGNPEETEGRAARTIDTGADYWVGAPTKSRQSELQDDAGLMMLADSAALDRSLFAGVVEPQVVPEELDGPAAALPRLVYIAKLTGLILAAAVLALVALQSATDLLGN